VSTTQPILAPEGADNTLAHLLVSEHLDLLSELAGKTRDTNSEYATTLYAPSGAYARTGIAPGEGKRVTSPDPPMDGPNVGVVRLHTHPPSSPIAFSTADVMHFVRHTLRSTPLGRLKPVQSGYGVVGQRPGDVSRNIAFVHTLEPTEEYAKLGVLGRSALRSDIAGVAEPTDVALETDGDPNAVLARLAPYVRYDRRKFSLLPQDRR